MYWGERVEEKLLKEFTNKDVIDTVEWTDKNTGLNVCNNSYCAIWWERFFQQV